MTMYRNMAYASSRGAAQIKKEVLTAERRLTTFAAQNPKLDNVPAFPRRKTPLATEHATPISTWFTDRMPQPLNHHLRRPPASPLPRCNLCSSSSTGLLLAPCLASGLPAHYGKRRGVILQSITFAAQKYPKRALRVYS